MIRDRQESSDRSDATLYDSLSLSLSLSTPLCVCVCVCVCYCFNFIIMFIFLFLSAFLLLFCSPRSVPGAIACAPAYWASLAFSFCRCHVPAPLQEEGGRLDNGRVTSSKRKNQSHIPPCQRMAEWLDGAYAPPANPPIPPAPQSLGRPTLFEVETVSLRGRVNPTSETLRG